MESLLSLVAVNESQRRSESSFSSSMAKIIVDSSNTIQYSGAYAISGVDNSVRLDNFCKNFKVDVKRLTDSDMEFDMIDIDPAIANTFRRILISEEIELEAHAVKSIGKTHVKWSPVSTAWYRMLSEEIELEAHVVKSIGKTHAKWSPVSTAWYRKFPLLGIGCFRRKKIYRDSRVENSGSEDSTDDDNIDVKENGYHDAVHMAQF